jgi:hypothetical protein
MEKPALCDAIKTKKRIQFIYHDKLRKGEPQCYGINKRGHEALRVHLLEGGTRPEQMFVLDKIKSLVILNETFYKAWSKF